LSEALVRCPVRQPLYRFFLIAKVLAQDPDRSRALVLDRVRSMVLVPDPVHSSPA
jgi:hypothetical protein